MAAKTDFSHIQGIAHIKWRMETQTPLCIKSGTISAWSQAAENGGKANKLREHNAEFDFFKKEKNGGADQLSDFRFDIALEDGALMLEYRIPPSGVRGALRNYTIRHLVKDPDLWNAGQTAVLKDLPSDEDQQRAREDQRRQMRNALKHPGWRMIQNLFGLATDSDDGDLADETRAGRLQIETGDLKPADADEFKHHLLAGTWSDFKPGPLQGVMRISTRNPIDRITHAAKEGGLHSFMELTPGNRFDVNLKFINPTMADLGFVAFWEQAINTGLLRLGGLTGVGRGRMHIRSSDITLYLRSPNAFNGLKPINPQKTDILMPLFSAYTVADWNNSQKNFLAHLKEDYENA